MQIPIGTYRIQFTPEFTFDHARAIAPYLAQLGLSTLYASPILSSRLGSTHGYDVTDPRTINPELGGAAAFIELRDILQQHQIDWLQDIVPNHMAFDSQNPMLVDVLENGPDSQYHGYFDIDWNHPYEGLNGKVLAPFLGKFYGDCLESGELQLDYDEPGLTINYYGMRFPIRIESYSNVLTYDLNRLRATLGRDHPAFVKLLGVLYMLKYIPSGEEGRERYDQICFIKQMLWELWNDSPDVQQFIKGNIKTFNGEPGHSESFNLLDELLKEQFFRLAYWKVGNEELNYRRFFTVNGLISLRVEEEAVFHDTHALTLAYIAEGKINGLRIDHIDGLYDPAAYLMQLRDQAPDIYLVVEKILEPGEELPLHWPIQGTSGYDFLNQVNGVFCQQASEPAFDTIYQRFIRRPLSSDSLIDENKRLIIGRHLAGDIDNLARLLKQLSGRYRYASDFTIYGLKAALIEILAVFPVYRTYINQSGMSRADLQRIQQVIETAKANIPNFLNELAFIEKFLTLEFDERLTEDEKQQWLHFLMRLQQFTGPLMAKGVEDTVLYVYNRLISLNEVGSHPGQFGLALDEFHHFNQTRAAQYPHAMNATATHDTKRGEDIRARLNVLSELPAEWEEQLNQWHKINAPLKQPVGEINAPDLNDEYFFYQTVLGAFAFEGPVDGSFVDRLKEYTIKAIREAKVHTAWLRPDSQYEEAFLQFVEQVLTPSDDNAFLAMLRPFQRKIQHYGILNSLSQTLLKLASPGVPDIYQGTELWDLSLVDPDNRRPVDYKIRQTYLDEIKTRMATDPLELIQALLQAPEDGRIKLFLIYQALQARRSQLELFQRGSYQKLSVVGSLRMHVIAFAREFAEQRAIAIAPRLTTALVSEGQYPLGEAVWHETRITLPDSTPSTWRDTLTGQVYAAEDTLWLREVLQYFPVALLVREEG